MKRLFLVAGESSGDIHGANLIRALGAARPDWSFEGLGGKLMATAGMQLRHDLAGEAIMGFVEVVRKLKPIRRLFLDTVAHLRETRPDALVLIDYPGFNLRLAAEAKKLGIPVIYYISPQVWAWKKRRIFTIKKVVDLMLVIFPFEEELYRKVGVPCAYVGHPLFDHLAPHQQDKQTDSGMLIGLLPGSREMEIRRIAPVMLSVVDGILEKYPEARFAVPCVDEARAAQVHSLAGNLPIDCRVDGMFDILSKARFCFVTSGTATLETALFGVPLAIVYKMNPLTYWIARLLVDIKYIGIVNILAGKEVAPEFIQHGARPDTLLPAALNLIEDGPARTRMLDDLRGVREKLGGPGASNRAAMQIIGLLEGVNHGR